MRTYLLPRSLIFMDGKQTKVERIQEYVIGMTFSCAKSCTKGKSDLATCKSWYI